MKLLRLDTSVLKLVGWQPAYKKQNKTKKQKTKQTKKKQQKSIELKKGSICSKNIHCRMEFTEKGKWEEICSRMCKKCSGIL